MKDIQEIRKENLRRLSLRSSGYDPIRGHSEPGRTEVTTPDLDCPKAYVPVSMTQDKEFKLAKANALAWKRLRIKHDFEYWCATCCTVRDKLTGADIKFVLNAPQRRVARNFERDRIAGRPLRFIILKARQWGASTLVQMYMAWIQSVHRKNCHSVVCSHIKDTSGVLRGMYSNLLAHYPPELWDGDEPPKFRAFEGSANIREIAGRGCRLTIASAENQDSLRGSDFSMAHLTETAFWRNSPQKSPEDVIRSVSASIPLREMTMIVMESTANGVGNFFHTEWLRCVEGKGDKTNIFVPWHEIEIYRQPIEDEDVERLVKEMDDYEWELWNAHGCCLDQIYWYHLRRREYSTHRQMMAEFPTTASEAFTATSSAVFGREHVDRLREGCAAGRKGDIDGRRFLADSAGRLCLWQLPEQNMPYVAAVDIGGRSDSADFSVIAVVKASRPKPEVVAQWRGHIDHDLLAIKAQEIAAFYNRALLVVESNTLESDAGAGSYILESLARTYTNLYRRKTLDGNGLKVGFHTNRATKGAIITTLVAKVRENLYIERDSAACDELDVYERHPDGSYGAMAGRHDDILMTRAIALWIIDNDPSLSTGATTFRPVVV